ncbi:hypothetical protein EDD22DRAFT_852175 [Suillus occidentalis]|nr:hypothetical protein EDD22DRAFT_852175 [Suillus occidentalis]
MADTDNAKSKRMVDTTQKSKRAADTDNAKSERQSKSLEKLVGVFAAEKWLWWPDNIDTFSMTSVEDAVSNTQLPTLLPSPINQRTEASEGQINEKARIRMAKNSCCTFKYRSAGGNTIGDLPISGKRRSTRNFGWRKIEETAQSAASLTNASNTQSGGRALLADLKRIAYAPCSNGRQARDREVKFLKSNLTEYAPAVPLSRTIFYTVL